MNKNRVNVGKQAKPKIKNLAAPVPKKQPIEPEMLSVVPRLSKCAAEYACALQDPFNCNGLACVPDFPAIPSRKMLTFIKGTMTIGTQGFGFVQSSPYNGIANDLNTVFYSQVAFAGTATAVTGVGVGIASTNSDYVQANIGAGVGTIQYRLVGAGIRIKYTGTELNRSGMVFHLEEPAHGNLNLATAANIEAYDACLKSPVTRSWHSVVVRPIHATECEYSFQVPGTGVAPPNNQLLTLVATSTAGNTFDFEYFGLFEVIGSTVRGKTPSDTDRLGMDAVLNSIQGQAKSGYVGEQKKTNIIESAWNSLMKGISGVASLAWENRGTIMNSALKAMSLL